MKKTRPIKGKTIKGKSIQKHEDNLLTLIPAKTRSPCQGSCWRKHSRRHQKEQAEKAEATITEVTFMTIIN